VANIISVDFIEAIFFKQGTKCPWIYGSLIYIYIQCLSPLKLWVRFSVVVMCTL